MNERLRIPRVVIHLFTGLSDFLKFSTPVVAVSPRLANLGVLATAYDTVEPRVLHGLAIVMGMSISPPRRHEQPVRTTTTEVCDIVERLSYATFRV
jgi:hypothetical protein